MPNLMSWIRGDLFLVLAICLAGCSTAVVPPPNVIDTWEPPEETEAISPLSCEEGKRLFAYDAQAPLDIQEEKRQWEDGVTEIDFTYVSPLGGRVPAILVIPDGGGPFAGLVLMHGSAGFRGSMLPLARAYARLGSVSIMISAPFARREHNSGQAFLFQEKDRREQIQLIVDLRRAIDILISRPEVDPRRMAYIGVSYGGAMGGLLAGVEDRLRGYVLQVGYGGPVNRYSGANLMRLPEGQRWDWVAWMWPIEPIHFVSCAAPAALLFQNGTLDNNVPPARAIRYQQAGSKPKTILWYPAGHDLVPQAYQDQAEWLSGIIGITSYRMAFPRSVWFALVAWFLLTVCSLAFLAWDLLRTRRQPRRAQMMWLLTILFLGAPGLIIYWITARQPRGEKDFTGKDSPARCALGSAAWAATGNLSGAVAALALLIYFPTLFGGNPILTITTVFLIPFCSGLLLIAASQWISQSSAVNAFVYHQPVVLEAVSTCLVLMGVYPLVNILAGRWFSRWAVFGFDLSYPPLWGGLCLGAFAGVLITYPFHLWMLRRGMIRWGDSAAPQEAATRELAWYLQAVLVVLFFAAMLVTILRLRGSHMDDDIVENANHE